MIDTSELNPGDYVVRSKSLPGTITKGKSYRVRRVGIITFSVETDRCTVLNVTETSFDKWSRIEGSRISCNEESLFLLKEE